MSAETVQITADELARIRRALAIAGQLIAQSPQVQAMQALADASGLIDKRQAQEPKQEGQG